MEIAKGDGLLRQGDIIVTPHGFLVFKGIAADGYANQFEPVPNPLNPRSLRARLCGREVTPHRNFAASRNCRFRLWELR